MSDIRKSFTKKLFKPVCGGWVKFYPKSGEVQEFCGFKGMTVPNFCLFWIWESERFNDAREEVSRRWEWTSEKGVRTSVWSCAWLSATGDLRGKTHGSRWNKGAHCCSGPPSGRDACVSEVPVGQELGHKAWAGGVIQSIHPPEIHFTHTHLRTGTHKMARPLREAFGNTYQI